jgi:23S rRNA pseudouridine1911/1915/1917 synthase
VPLLRLTLPESARRLDALLAALLADQGISRSLIQRLMKEGRVRVEGRVAKASAEARAGQEVALELEEPSPGGLAPLDLPLSVLYEDDCCLAVDKPAGMVTHPAKGHRDDTLVNILKARVPSLSSGFASDRPGILHRLDKETSGVLLVAKNDRAQAMLASQFSQRTVRKLYLALVWGTLPLDLMEVDEPIGRHPAHRQKMAVVKGGRESRTLFITKERLPFISLVEARPATGRTHQIRVHLAHLRHPVVGDALYGGHPENGLPSKRLQQAVREAGRFFLHAHSLAFRSPSGSEVTVTSPLPKEFARLMEVFRSHA